MKKIALITFSIFLASATFAQKESPKKEDHKSDQKEVKVKVESDKAKEKVEKHVFQENEKQVKHIDVSKRKREIGSSTDLSGSGNAKGLGEQDKGKSLERVREEAENEKAERKERMMVNYRESIEGGEDGVKEILESNPENIKTLVPEKRLEANKIRANFRLTEIAEQIRVAEAKIAAAEQRLANDAEANAPKVEVQKEKITQAKVALEKLKEEMSNLKRSVAN
ncbi:MAG: hypothetical protein GC193_01655 [Cryomorphaceae bacterium]|nr:hypothetical protein [Cryomorphaceae bacterium]